MSSTFGGLSTALSALYSQRKGMDTTGQNVANANTEGYTRQRAEMTPLGGSATPAMYAIWDGPGTGVAVESISRLRDNFLEQRGRAEHSQSSLLDLQQQTYGRIENIFAEPSDTALQSQLGDLWAGFGDIANNPGDGAARTQLLQRANVVADGINARYAALNSQWDTSRAQLDGFTTQMNNAADAVAQLNYSIQQAQGAGLPTNELQDKRDLRMMELAQLGGVTTVARSNGSVDVFLGGSTLVSGGSARHIQATGGTQLTDLPATPVTLKWTDNNTVATVTAGSVAANQDILNNVIPGIGAKLDQVAQALANSVNPVHQAGFGLDGVSGRSLFVDSSGVLGITARTISVGIANPDQLGAATVAGTLDGTNAQRIADLASSAAGPDKVYRSMVVQIGVSSQTSQRRFDIQQTVTQDMDALRSADAGVNLDEEMTNLVSYQKAYSAAARVMTSVDEALDTLINRTGLVGR